MKMSTEAKKIFLNFLYNMNMREDGWVNLIFTRYTDVMKNRLSSK